MYKVGPNQFVNGVVTPVTHLFSVIYSATKLHFYNYHEPPQIPQNQKIKVLATSKPGYIFTINTSKNM